MKKIKTIIIIIYISVVTLISAGTIFFIAQTFTKATKIYFQEKKIEEQKLPIQEEEILKIIDDLMKYQLIQ